MLLLFNKTIKPLNQFAKKNPKEACLFLLMTFFTIFNKIFSQFFFVTQVFMNLSFMQSIRKRNSPFWIYSTSNIQKWQQYLQRKPIMSGRDITIILILHINSQD